MAKELYLYSPIYDFVAEGLLSQIEDNFSIPITLRANSGGGDVKAGFGICAKIAEHGNVTIKVDGSADSMMANILMYAKKAEGLDVSTFLLHRAAYPEWYKPNSSEQSYLENMNKDLKAKMLLKINAEKFQEVCGYSIDQMFDSEQRIDIRLTAKEAKAIGLIQKINKLTPAEVEAFNHKMAVDSIATPQNHNTHTVMNKEEIKAKFPDAYNSILNEGITAERDRVGAWATFASADPEKVIKAIKEGEAMSQTAMAELSLKSFNAQSLEALKKDSAPGVTTPEVPVGATSEEAKAEAEAKAFKEAVMARIKENL